MQVAETAQGLGWDTALAPDGPQLVPWPLQLPVSLWFLKVCQAIKLRLNVFNSL